MLPGTLVPWMAYCPPGPSAMAAAPIGLFGAPPAMTLGRCGLSRFTAAGGDQAGLICISSTYFTPLHWRPALPTAMV